MEYQITKVDRREKKIKIEIDGVYHLFLYSRDLKKQKFLHIDEGNIITEEEITQLNQHVLSRGKKRIMYLLGKQDYPKKQLEDKLLREGYNEEHIQKILAPFLEKEIINDTQLLQRRIQGYKGSKSRLEIQANLQKKGFNKNEIQSMLRESISWEDEFKSATQLLHKKFFLKRLKIEEHTLKQKALSYLSRKGYAMDICIKAYECFIEECTWD